MGEDIYVYSAADDMLAEIVAGRLRAAGHRVEHGPDAAMREALLSGAFSLAIFDAQLADALEVLAKLKQRAAQTRAVLLLPEHAGKPSAGLRIEGEASLVEPFEVAELNAAVDAQLAALAADPSVQVLSVAFTTTDDHVEAARQMLEERLSGVAVLDESQRFHLLTAFGEAIGNAALHGNKARRDRIVRLWYEQAQEHLSLTVCDEGPGFDWRSNESQATNGSAALAQAAAREAQGKLGGLGLNLMRQVCDAVEFNPAGNRITLRKSLPVQPRAV